THGKLCRLCLQQHTSPIQVLFSTLMLLLDLKSAINGGAGGFACLARLRAFSRGFFSAECRQEKLALNVIIPLGADQITNPAPMCFEHVGLCFVFPFCNVRSRESAQK